MPAVIVLFKHLDSHVKQKPRSSSYSSIVTREYWLIYRGLGFHLLLLAPPPLPSVSSTGDTQEEWEWEGGRGRGVKSYDGKKAWSSINHSILSDCDPPFSNTVHIHYVCLHVALIKHAVCSTFMNQISFFISHIFDPSAQVLISHQVFFSFFVSFFTP